MELNDLINGNCYHICTNGHDAPLLMRDEDDYRIACTYLALLAWKLNIDIYVYIIMSNHIHVLMSCRDRKEAEKFIRAYKQKLSLYFRHKYGDSKAFKGISESITLVDSLQYFRNCVAYILRNALSARVCMRIEDYPWSSYSAYFARSDRSGIRRVDELGVRERREVLRSNLDLDGCPLCVDVDGRVTNKSFVRYEIVEKVFKNSSRSFLYSLGTCNDSKMEYELALKPQININDLELLNVVERLVQSRFAGKSLADLTQTEKCSMIKNLYFNTKTSIPQLSRILGLSRQMVSRILTY